ncbi:hypothetical protein [Marinospirillum minutulum]|uniref:hypothetical protein n=1 Tax=Marinospirillum minutulum TaxID=64974 RepID=UPI00040331CD|nr:hypothetical protein [Marinospirillum minutulum]
MPLTFSSDSLRLANSKQANTIKAQAGTSTTMTNDSLTRSRVAPEDSAAKENKRIYLHLSEEAKNKSRLEKKKEAIDKSDLPTKIKDHLKRIHELKEELRKLEQALKKVMANNNISEEQKDLQAAQIQTQINALNSALLSTMNSLIEDLKEEPLTAEQASSFAELLL